MKEIKSSNQKRTCPELMSAGCVTWNGANIPALGIYTGDTLTETVYSVACKVSEIASELNLDSLNLECLIDSCGTSALNKDLKFILQALLDNQCSLKKLIDDLSNSNNNSDSSISTNMKCLKKYDEFENEIKQDLSIALQSIVNQVCTNTADISLIKSQVSSLQDDFNDIDFNPVSPEPTVATCVTGGPKKVTTVVNLLASDYCNYQTVLGSVVDIQNALGNLTPNLRTKIGNPDGYINTPTNEAQVFNNALLAITNLLDRVAYMEATCCKPSCDSVKVGFLTEFDGDTVILRFTSGAGTNIPTGYTDCGSVLTISNKDNTKSFSVDIQITQGGETDNIDLSLSTFGEELLFNINTKLCNDSMTCEKCIGKLVKYESGCCVITNDGSEDAIIIYNSPINSNG